MRWKLLGVLLLGLLVLSSFGGAAVPSNEVSPVLAEKAAKTYVNWIAVNIPDFKEWRGATLGKPITYYFPNGEKSAYEFAVFKNGKNVGFILISARRDMPPVLEFSKANPSSWNLEKVKELAEKKGYKAGKLLYYGALTYSVDIGNGKAIGLKDMKVRKYPMKVELKFNKEKAKKEWEEIANIKAITDTKEIVPMSSTPIFIWNKVYGVPAWTSTDLGNANVQYPNNVGPDPDPWDEWDGCAPIAGSMIIAYYEPQLQDDWNREAIIDILHHTMGTLNGGGTIYPGQVTAGIALFDEEYNELLQEGIVSESISHEFSAYTDYYVSEDDVIREIDDDKPFVLSMNYHWVNGHAVAVIGYTGWKYNDGGLEYIELSYIIVHDPNYPGEDHYIAWNDWTTAAASFVTATGGMKT